MENKQFEELKNMIQGIDNRLGSLEDKVNSLDDRVNSLDDKVNSLDDRIDQKLKENNEIIIKRVDEKLMDHGAYFEHKYGEQISAIWTKLQVMDDRKDLDHEEIRNLEKRFDQNSLELMAHDMRISKLEEKISS